MYRVSRHQALLLVPNEELNIVVTRLEKILTQVTRVLLQMRAVVRGG